MTRALRIVFVLTHPVQYYAPWFRYITAHRVDLELTVLHAIEPTDAQQGLGFDRAIRWDVALTEGYRARFVRRAREQHDLGRFLGLHVPEIGAALLAEQPDVVVIPGWQSVALVRAGLAARRAGIPILYRGETNLDAEPAGWRAPLWRARTRLLLAGFDGYLSIGRRADAYLTALGRSSVPRFGSPYCVDNAYFAACAAPFQVRGARAAARAELGIGEHDFVALFAGKLQQHKRPLDVIEAVARLGAGARLLLVGAGPLEARCREVAAASGATVSFAGFLNQSELGRAYAVSDCLVLPSQSETWGLVVNEAMATGLPCVVSDRVGCASDLIAEDTGWSYPVGDVAALTAALTDARQGRVREADVRARVAHYTFAQATEGLAAGCHAVAS